MSNLQAVKEIAKSVDMAAKKPVPENPEEWVNELHGMFTWIRRKKFMARHFGEEWARKQELYFNARISYLLDNVPKH